MKKEVIIAILVGFGIGLLITLGIHATRRKSNPAINPATQISPTPTIEIEHSIVVTSPLENTVQTDKNVLIKGQTSADSTIVLESENTSQIQLADKSGFFEAEFPIIMGPNKITITSYSTTGTSATYMLEITREPDTDTTSEEANNDES